MTIVQDRGPAQNSSGILLSAVEVVFSAAEFEVLQGSYDPEVFAKLRARPDLFVYRDHRQPIDSQTLVVPLASGISLDGYGRAKIRLAENRKMFVRLLERRLPAAFPDLDLHPRKFSLQRVRESEDLVGVALARAGLPRSPLLTLLHKHHRTELVPRLEFVRGRGSLVIVAVQFGTKAKLTGMASDLIAAGADIRELQAFVDGSYAGRVVGADESSVQVAGESGLASLPSNSVTIEPSLESFARFFESALGPRASTYFAAERRLIAEKLSGGGYVRYLHSVAEHLKKSGERQLAPSVSFRFSGLLESRSRDDAAIVTLAPVEYCFSPDRSATDRIPSQGLDRYGPFDGRSFDRKESHILVVGPQELRSEVEQLVGRLRDGLEARSGDKKSYKGMLATYRLSRMRFSFVDAPPVARSGGDVGAAYVSAMRSHFENERPPDAVLIVLRDEEAFLTGARNPYLAAKAWLLSQGVPSQAERLEKLRASRSDLPYILEDTALALYAKLGGCPWTVAPSRPLVHEVILGMAYAEFGDRFRSRARYMGITAVFTSDGSYVMAAASPRCPYDAYPAALAETVRKTVARLKRDQGWAEGDTVRLVFHSAKPLTNDDISNAVGAAVQELGRDIHVEPAVLTILRDHPFTIAAPSEKGRPTPVERFDGSRGWATVGAAAPSRGICFDLGDTRRLLCVNGPFLIRREGDPIPQPLLLELHQQSVFKDMTALTRQVFQLTGLSWRSVRPASEPVTLQYPRLIAKLIGRLEQYPGWSDTLMDTRLMRSRWFL